MIDIKLITKKYKHDNGLLRTNTSKAPLDTRPLDAHSLNATFMISFFRLSIKYIIRDKLYSSELKFVQKWKLHLIIWNIFCLLRKYMKEY